MVQDCRQILVAAKAVQYSPQPFPCILSVSWTFFSFCQLSNKIKIDSQILFYVMLIIDLILNFLQINNLTATKTVFPSFEQISWFSCFEISKPDYV